jgi:hypothetical protein
MSNLTRWFFPCSSGDFRLSRADDGCILSVEDPTSSDKALLLPLMEAAREHGWVEAMIGIAPKGLTEISLSCSLEDAGKLVGRGLFGDKPVWTALRHVDGHFSLEGGPIESFSFDPPVTDVEASPENTAPLDGADVSPWSSYKHCTKCEALTGVACTNMRSGADTMRPHKERKLVMNATVPAEFKPGGSGVSKKALKGVVAAASVRPPRLGCPAPVETNRRASEVLRAFSTASQWREWQQHASMRVIGSHSGQAFRVHHRNSAVAKGLPHVLERLSDGKTICAWDDRVPAEEEALAMKFAVEHRETYLLGLGVQGRDLVRRPVRDFARHGRDTAARLRRRLNIRGN